MRGLKIFLVGFALLTIGGYAWDWVMTKVILRQRDYTMALVDDMRMLAVAVQEGDAGRTAKNLPSIYPRDAGVRTPDEYFRYLVRQGVLPKIPERARSMRIGNVSRLDPPETVFLLSAGVMRDIHGMIHNIGGYPHYAAGYLSITKNGSGQFYRTGTPVQATGRAPAGGFLE